MKCDICVFGCELSEKSYGRCGNYYFDGSEIKERFPDRYLTCCPISIETMPMLHYYPQGRFFQVTTFGCNLNCKGCVAKIIAKGIAGNEDFLYHFSPKEIVQKAMEEKCLGITFLINDPIASFYTFLALAREAKKHNLKIGCASNALFTQTAFAKLLPYLDFINFGVKAYSNLAEKKAVFSNILSAYEKGVHVEIAVIHSKGSEASLKETACEIANLSKSIPLQLMRFIPLEDSLPQFEPSIYESEKFVEELKSILDFVYLFNSPGTDLLNTACKECGNLLYKRDFYGPMGAKVRSVSLDLSKCDNCSKNIVGANLPNEEIFSESGFSGGYPFTRALDMMEAIAIALQETKHSKMIKLWQTMLKIENFKDFHEQLQDVEAYLKLIEKFGILLDRGKEAQDLTKYFRAKLDLIAEKIPPKSERKKVLYCMGQPNFVLKSERLENKLVELAGGISLNKTIAEKKSRPGFLILDKELESLNPDFIFISGFLADDLSAIYNKLEKSNLQIKAKKNQNIFLVPKVWDFGSPRIILGIMFIAQKLYPHIFDFDMLKGAQEFYKKFYKQDYNPDIVNRSFSKPDAKWCWEE